MENNEAQEMSTVSPSTSISEDCIISPHSEVGFLFLKSTPITLAIENPKHSLNFSRQWIDVDVKNEESDENQSENGKDAMSSYSLDCPRCNLVLSSNNGNHLEFTPHSLCTFTGMMKDVKCCPHHSQKAKKNETRSDASILLGTILSCKNRGYVRIEKFQMLIDAMEHHSDEEQKQEDDIDHIEYITVNASLVITGSLPHLEKLSKMYHEKSQQLDSFEHYDEYLSMRSTGFEAYGQLLFSLIRTDWEWLDKAMERLVAVNQGRMNRPDPNEVIEQKRIFPPQMTLEAMYKRIRGASGNLVSDYSTLMLDNTESRQLAGKLTLPEDILHDNIAPFLRAKSLNSLRTTCRYLHHVLKSCVPGLKLRLFPHQIRSLEWMRRREEHQYSEDDTMMSKPNNVSTDEILCGDQFRSVTAGTIVSIVPRHDRKRNIFWHINCWTGVASLDYKSECIRDVAKCRKVARGGMLCDDPGLGKTITVLSLILQTLGERTNSDDLHKVSDDMIIEAYWRESLVGYTRQQQLQDIILRLRKIDLQGIFYYPVQSVLTEEEWKTYKSIVHQPICMENVISKITKDAYDGKDGLDAFTSDVNLIFSNAMLYNPEDSCIHRESKKLQNAFETILETFKMQQMKAALASAKRSTLSLVSLVKESRKIEVLKNLLPTGGTLLVVPATLLGHWEEQIKKYINFSYLSKKEPLIYRHKTKSNYNRTMPFLETSDKKKFDLLCNVEKTHFPLLFIDDCTDKLPKESMLSQFTIVLTTVKRFSREWKHGSFEQELYNKNAKSGRTSRSYRSFNYNEFDEHSRTRPCSLLKILFLRLVVDEGHSMGAKGQSTNAIDFASWVPADRRWLMTGTPTPQTLRNTGIGNLFGLFRFLQHDFLCTPKWGEERCKFFTKGTKEGRLSTFYNLMHLLNLAMVRHTKKDVTNLYRPILKRTQTNMSRHETQTYNTLVSAIQTNLIATSMEGKTSGEQDSLLYAANRKHAQQVLNNIRLSCCGTRQVVPTLTTANWNETVDMMKEHLADDPNQETKLTLVQDFLLRLVSEQLSSCMSCGIEMQTLFLLPCACVICTECITPQTTSCPACNKEFDIDEFQRLQPGIDFNWKFNIEEAQRKRNQERSLASALARTRANGDTDRGDNADRVVNNQPANQNGVNNPQNNAGNIQVRRGGHVCIFPEEFTDGRCLVCKKEHYDCFMLERDNCEVCHAPAEDCPKEETKPYYIVNKLCQLWGEYKNRGLGLNGEEKRPLKVLIFSQFRSICNAVADKVIRKFGHRCVAEYWNSTREADLMRFRTSKECFCMILPKEGAVGLNLTFCTHIFFLDEILDKSLESQVVSRAYRMGATEPVFVEQLIAKHSIEELIVNLNKNSNIHDDLYSETCKSEIVSELYPHEANSIQDNVKPNRKHNQQAFLLSNVKLIRPSARVGKKRHNVNLQKSRKKKVRFV